MRKVTCEKNLSTEQAEENQYLGIPCTYEHSKRSQDRQSSESKRPQAPNCLINFAFPKRARLKSRNQFNSVQAARLRFVGPIFIVDWNLSKFSSSRLGIVAKKKDPYKLAVDRNRFKRFARESFRLSQHLIPQGFDLILRPRSRAKEASINEFLENWDLFTQFISSRGSVDVCNLSQGVGAPAHIGT
jgi:ribonuclease P protein component